MRTPIDLPSALLDEYPRDVGPLLRLAAILADIATCGNSPARQLPERLTCVDAKVSASIRSQHGRGLVSNVGGDATAENDLASTPDSSMEVG